MSRICAGLDETVEAFRGRRLDRVEFPYVYLDASCPKVCNSVSRVASMAMVAATGVTAGVRLVTADAHAGLAAAADRTIQRAGRQRCRVHFIRNLLALVPRSHQHMAAAAFRTIFAQPDPGAVRDAWDEVAAKLRARFPKVAALMADAKPEAPAFAALPRAHWQKIWSTNPLERINKDIKRRSRVVGIFPNQATAIRLVGAILADLHDEWQATERRYLSEHSMATLSPERDTIATAELTPGNQHRGSTPKPTTPRDAPYLLDANVFIQAKNLHYGFEFCPAFWDWLDQENAAGNVFSIERVGDELLAGDDELAAWARQRPGLFLAPGTTMVPSLTTVSMWASGAGCEPTGVATFLQVADYYPVAQAHAHQYVVVTHEVFSPSPKKIKIPNACIGVGVKSVNPYEMLRTERAKFILGPAT